MPNTPVSKSMGGVLSAVLLIVLTSGPNAWVAAEEPQGDIVAELWPFEVPVGEASQPVFEH